MNVPMHESFITLINASLADCGYSDRSKFIRDAVREKLDSMGISVPRQITQAPMRCGKAKVVRYPSAQSQSMKAADEPSKARSKAPARKKPRK